MSYKFGKILVVQQKMIGDVLTSTILLEALRKKFPQAELHYLINSHTIPVVENNPFVDKLMLFTPEMERNKSVLYRFLKQIKKEKYDLCIDVYGKLSSLLITYFSKAPQRISYHKKHTAFLYTTTIKRLENPVQKAGLAIENRMKLIEPLGIHFSYLRPKIFLAPAEIEQGKQTLKTAGLDLNRPIFMLNVLGSSPKKTYPLEYMANFVDRIIELTPEAQLLFNYLPSQEEEAKSIRDRCRPETQKKIHFEVYGRNLREFLALTKACDALLGNEGGAVNMAKALNIPTFMIFCPFIKKQNWFGELETLKNQAVHLSDYAPMTSQDIAAAKKNPDTFYSKLSPELIYPQLESFLKNLAQP